MTPYRVGFVVEQALGHVTHARALQRNLADPEVLACWAPIPWETGGIARRLPVYRSNWTVRAGLRARRALSRMTRRHPLDALFFHTQVPAVLARDWVGRVPSVVSLDATPLQYDTLGGAYGHARGPDWVEHLKWRWHRAGFRAARRLVTWSEWARGGLVSGYGIPVEKITVIPPGVDIADWSRPAARPAHAGPVRILFVGGDFARKGGPSLIEVFRALRPLGVELHVVTRDAVPPEPGLVVHDGMEPDSPPLRRLYHDSDVFCLPTLGDCLGIALVEAAAAGLPLIATEVGATREVVEPGVTGLLIPPGDASALAEALRALASSPVLRLDLGSRGAELAARRFDARRNTRRLLELIKREAAVAGAPGPA